MIGNIVLPIFFLYFVLISGYCSAILNCGLQRFMRDSIYFKHFLILLSIYIFTFILNWYTFDSLSISQLENFEDSKPMKLSYESLKKFYIQSPYIYYSYYPQNLKSLIY